MNEAMPAVAVVAESDLNRHLLKNMLLDAGYRIHCSIAPAQLSRELERAEPEAIDAWLVDISDNSTPDLLETIDEGSAAPWLINDDIPPAQDTEAHSTWRRRLLAKLEEVAVIGPGTPVSAEPVSAVWVLAASTGGPAAVGEFVRALPPGLPLALVYVQHIDDKFDSVLADAMGRDKKYAIGICRGEQRLETGRITVVPADRQLRFLPFDRVIETRKPWPGPYRPAIDQVVAELARLYRERCGVIVFTGMCDDGAIGCRVMQACGGRVWAQSPDSCISDDMPRAALATGAVTRQGTPAELAAALAAQYATARVNHERTAAE